MAKMHVEEKAVKTVRTFHLTLSEREAALVRVLLGKVSGGNKMQWNLFRQLEHKFPYTDAMGKCIRGANCVHLDEEYFEQFSDEIGE